MRQHSRQWEQETCQKSFGYSVQLLEMLYQLSLESYLWVEQHPIAPLYSHLLLLILLKEKLTGSQGTFYRLVSSQRHEGSGAISFIGW